MKRVNPIKLEQPLIMKELPIKTAFDQMMREVSFPETFAQRESKRQRSLGFGKSNYNFYD